MTTYHNDMFLFSLKAFKSESFVFTYSFYSMNAVTEIDLNNIFSFFFFHFVESNKTIDVQLPDLLFCKTFRISVSVETDAIKRLY